MPRPTVAQLYNAAVAMNLAEDTPEHQPRTDEFLDLFDRARPWTRAGATGRIVVRRIRRRRQR